MSAGNKRGELSEKAEKAVIVVLVTIDGDDGPRPIMPG
jgi:hypothetical protein